MNLQEKFGGDDVDVRQFDYEDRTVWAADLAPAVDADLDVVDDTAIVVADDEQFEVDLADDAQAFIKNGVFTIEVRE